MLAKSYRVSHADLLDTSAAKSVLALPGAKLTAFGYHLKTTNRVLWLDADSRPSAAAVRESSQLICATRKRGKPIDYSEDELDDDNDCDHGYEVEDSEDDSDE